MQELVVRGADTLQVNQPERAKRFTSRGRVEICSYAQHFCSFPEGRHDDTPANRNRLYHGLSREVYSFYGGL